MTDRIIVYPGQVPADTDMLTAAKSTMLAVHGLLQATIGTSSARIAGFDVSPGTGLSVSVGAGVLIAPGVAIDAAAYGSLGTDSGTCDKLGILDAATTLGPFAAPSTSGQSITYLIEAAFAETDTNSALLLYYNANNPSVPYGGSNNSGVSQPTLREQTVTLSVVAGTAAPTGSQSAPATTSGCVAVATVSVAGGQTSISASDIAASGSSSRLLSRLAGALQSSDSLADASSLLVSSGWAQAVVAAEKARAVAAEAAEVSRAEAAEARLAPLAAFTSNLASPGYLFIPCSSSPTGRIIFQWGTVSVGAPSAVTFPTTFPNAALGLVVCEANATSATWGAVRPTIHGYQSLTQSGYAGWAEAWTGSSWQGGSIAQSFFAWGY